MTENGSTASSPTSRLPPSPSSRGAAALAAREKERRRTASIAQNASSSGSIPGTSATNSRGVPSYFKATKASKMRSTSAGNIMKNAAEQNTTKMALAKTGTNNDTVANKQEVNIRPYEYFLFMRVDRP